MTKKYNDIDTIINLCNKAVKEDIIKELSSIGGIGENIALSIIKHFTNESVLILIERLKTAGLNFKNDYDASSENINNFLNGTKWVITGSFENYKPRDKAGEIIKKYGGEITDSVSSKTTYLLCGESPGSKLDKAKKIGIKVLSEKDFIELISRNIL